MDTMILETRLDDARTERDAFNKKIADTKADILELLAERGLLDWKNASCANGYLTDMMSDLTFDARVAINDALDEASRPIEAAEYADLRRSSRVVL